MYISNKTLGKTLMGLCCSSLFTGAVYLTANTERIARWKEDTFFTAATVERADSTRQMLETVRARVDTMSPDELRHTAEQCEELYDSIVWQYLAQTRELGNRRLTVEQQHEEQELLICLDEKLRESP